MTRFAYRRRFCPGVRSMQASRGTDRSTGQAEIGSSRVSQVASAVPHRPLLVVRPPDVAGEACGPEFSKPAILRAVARRGLPNLIEATIIPAILFYVLVVTVSGVAAMIGALAWA